MAHPAFSWEIQLLLISFELQIFIFVEMPCGNENLSENGNMEIFYILFVFFVPKNRCAYLLKVAEKSHAPNDENGVSVQYSNSRFFNKVEFVVYFFT